MRTAMKQQCYLWSVWLTWLALPLPVLVVALRSGWLAAVLVLVVGVAAQLVYVRNFPRLSGLLGYGSVTDEVPSGPATGERPANVTLYTASLCPFCPIVRQRLQALQRDLEFELSEVDVTLKPDLLRRKGIRAVPVVEVDGRMLHGNATSAQLLELLSPEEPGHRVPADPVARSER